jgi:hypothetical protein
MMIRVDIAFLRVPQLAAPAHVGRGGEALIQRP